MKTSYFFTENNLKSFFRPGWKGMGDPGVEEVETRIFVKPERGCGAVYLPCLRRFYALFLIKNNLHSPISPVLTVSRIFTGIIECDSQQSSDTQQIRII